MTRFLQALLFQIHPTDLVTLLGTARLLLLTIFLATLLPAYRASRLNPVVALRQQQ